MKKQQGFTLIELVVVIIILGILAVAVAPRFIDVQSGARHAALTGLAGAIQGSNSMLHAGALLNGTFKDKDTTINTVPISFGYLKATHGSLSKGVDIQLSDVPEDGVTPVLDWVVVEKKARVQGSDSNEIQTPGVITIKQNGAKKKCILTYTEAKSVEDKPTILVAPKTDCE